MPASRLIRVPPAVAAETCPHCGKEIGPSLPVVRDVQYKTANGQIYKVTVHYHGGCYELANGHPVG